MANCEGHHSVLATVVVDAICLLDSALCAENPLCRVWLAPTYNHVCFVFLSLSLSLLPASRLILCTNPNTLR